MVCNPIDPSKKRSIYSICIDKCKELVIRKKCNITEYPVRHNIKQYSHVKILAYKDNRCLYVIRGLRKEGYSQEEINLCFKAVVLSKLVYGLSVYGASIADLNIIQCFLDRCTTRHYASELFNIQGLTIRKI